MQNQTPTQKIIHTLDKRDKFFRVFQICVATFTMTAVLFTCVQTITTNQQLTESINQQKAQSIRNTQERTAQLKQIQEDNKRQDGYVACIATTLVNGSKDISVCK